MAHYQLLSAYRQNTIIQRVIESVVQRELEASITTYYSPTSTPFHNNRPDHFPFAASVSLFGRVWMVIGGC